MTPSQPGPGDEKVAEDSTYLDTSEEWESGSEALPEDPAPKRAGAQSTQMAPARGPAQNSVSPTAIRRKGRATVRGVARSVKMLQQDENSKTMAFRVDRYDDSGNRMEPVAVELRKYRSGQISEGEEVEVKGTWKHGALRARSVTNLTTGVNLRRLPRALLIPAVLFALLVLGFIAFVAFNVFNGVRGFGSPFEVPNLPSAEPPGFQQMPFPQPAGSQADRQPSGVQPPAAQPPPAAQRPVSAPSMVRVPNLFGDDSSSGSQQISDAGLIPRVVEEPSSTFPEGTVIRTDPASGEQAPQGSVVTLFRG